MEERWIELQFYYLCIDILNLRGNIADIMDFIDGMSYLGSYSPLIIKQIANEVIHSPYIRPSKDEFILLCRLNKLTIEYIRKRTKTCNREIYDLWNQHKDDLPYFRPRLQPDQIHNLKQFLEFLHTMKGWGIQI